ncbi:MAG: hypothetical protein C4555_05190 [Dehalococcoidia bacterium]|nr:MAG: hypothetical protein C4555_05190 [Dehalococcoidia bacterium]
MGSTGILQNPLTQQLLTPQPAPDMNPANRFQYYMSPEAQMATKQHAIDAMRRSATAPNPSGSNAYGGGRGPDYFSGQSILGNQGGGGGGGFQPGGGGGEPGLRAGFGEPTMFDAQGRRIPGTGAPGEPHGFGVGGGDPNDIRNLQANFGTYNDLGFYGGPGGGRLPWHSLYQSFDPRLNYSGPGPYTIPNIQHPLLGLLGQWLSQGPQGSAPVTGAPPTTTGIL